MALLHRLCEDVKASVLQHVAARAASPGQLQQVVCLAGRASGAAQTVRAWCRRLASPALLRALPLRLRALFYADRVAPATAALSPASEAEALRSPECVLSWVLSPDPDPDTHAAKEAASAAVRVAFLCERLAGPHTLRDFVLACHPHLQHLSATGMSRPQLIRCLAAALGSAVHWRQKLCFVGGYFAACPPPPASASALPPSRRTIFFFDVLRAAAVLACAAAGAGAGGGRELYLQRVQGSSEALAACPPEAVAQELAAAMRPPAGGVAGPAPAPGGATASESSSLQLVFDAAGDWLWIELIMLLSDASSDAAPAAPPPAARPAPPFGSSYDEAHTAFLDGRPPAGSCVFADAATAELFWPDLPTAAKVHAALCHGPALSPLLRQEGARLAAQRLVVSLPACVYLGVPWRVADILAHPAFPHRHRRAGSTFVAQTLLSCVEGGQPSEGRLLAAAEALCYVDAALPPPPHAPLYDPCMAERVLALACRSGSARLLSLWSRRCRPCPDAASTDANGAASAFATRVVPVRVWEPMLLRGELSLLRQVVLCGGVPADLCRFASTCSQRHGGDDRAALEACRAVLGPLWSDRRLALQGFAAFSAAHRDLRAARWTTLDPRLHKLWRELERGYLRAVWVTGPSRAPADSGPSAARVQASVLRGLLSFVSDAKAAHAADPRPKQQPQNLRPGHWSELLVDMAREDVQEAVEQLGLALQAAAPPTQLVRASLQRVVNSYNRAVSSIPRGPPAALAPRLAAFLTQDSLARALLHPTNGALGRDAAVRARCAEALSGRVQFWELCQHRCPQVAMLWRLVVAVMAASPPSV